MRLSPDRRRWLYTIAVPLAGTGCVWAVAHYAFGDTPAAARAVEVWSMKLHGGLAMAALVVVGMLLPVHVQPGLRAGEQVRSGIAMLALVALLVLTGYGLYYLGDELWREAARFAHLALGVAAAVWLPRHRRGRSVKLWRPVLGPKSAVPPAKGRNRRALGRRRGSQAGPQT
jgi:hypothetical protein